MKADQSTRVSPRTAEQRQQFRAQATGIGQTLDASRATGMRRASRIVDNAAGRNVKVEDNSYPQPMGCAVQVTVR
jgi:hypothetical protein